MQDLGHWAVIDIETTGIDPNYDDIIDIGFLQFEGTKLVKTYSSLVKTDKNLSRFIQKLTGITPHLLKDAPQWSRSEDALLDLEGHHLIAHNAAFEESFLAKYFEDLGSEREQETFDDSIYFLALLFPERSSLNLESLLVDLAIADTEEHRGLADSRDLLKVLLLSSYLTHFDVELRAFLLDQLSNFPIEDMWFYKLFRLEKAQLEEIAQQIDFSLAEAFENYRTKIAIDEGKIQAGDKDLSFNGENIKNILRNEEELRKDLSEYRFRASQEQLALRVGQAFSHNIHALIQAPTGTGKTLGYLIPSVLKAKHDHEQVLISTGTKTLQNQAMDKDIPIARKVLQLDESKLKVLRLVGSANHYCELLFRNDANQEDGFDLDTFEEKFVKTYYESLFFHNRRVQNYRYILTKENVPFVLKRKLKKWSEIEAGFQVDFRACTGSKCPFVQDCSYMQGLRKAKEADVIVGNHALLMSWPRGIERPQYVVIDEAHKLEGEATRAFTFEIGQAELEQMARNLPQMIAPVYYLLGNNEKDQALAQRIRSEVTQTAKMIQENVEELKNMIERFARKLPRYTDIYWNEFLMFKQNQLKDSLETSLFNQLDSLRYIFQGLNDLIYPLTGRWEVSQLNDENELKAYSLFESAAGHIEESFMTLEKLMNDDEQWVGTVGFHDEHGFNLNSSPVDIGELFYDSVLKQTEAVVFTSATLSNADGSIGMGQIEWMTGYNLLPPEKRFRAGMFLENNYDYKNNAKVFLCTDTTSIHDSNYVANVLEELVPLIRDIGGRSLLLYSARTRFEKACEILLNAFDGEIPLFIQGLGKNIVEDFKQSEQGILVGMESFGEGIDIPGDNLVFVYVDKVPDLRQDQLTQKRRDFYQATFGNEFNDYFLGHRTRSLHQKLGRLIRREQDKGCVIVTDARLKKWKPRTLQTFSDMMKPYQLEITNLNTACSDVRDFLL